MPSPTQRTLRWPSGSKERPSAGGLFLCTQNVDGLHEAAGSEDVVHIHGKLFESRCAADCGRPAFADHNGYSAGELPRCACGALVRPNVCWFGEQPYQLDRIYDALAACEVFIAIGTSGSVQPVASFVTMLKQRATACPDDISGADGTRQCAATSMKSILGRQRKLCRKSCTLID